MQFAESYFEEEEREGFIIKPMMKRVWAAQLELLEMVDTICAQHNIRYFAGWGTLLGAVRHKGYIPWDDDLDICMLRTDYERFIQIAATELPSYCWVRYADTDADWNDQFARLLNSRHMPQIPMEWEIQKRFHDCPYCVGIDIFPIDYLPNDAEERDTHLELFCAVYCLARDIRKAMKVSEEDIENIKMIESLCNTKFTNKKPIQQQLQSMADRIAAMYFDMGGEALECTQMYCMARSERFRFPVSCFAQTLQMPFENTTIPVPVGYEQVLAMCYGKDYMKPVQNKAGHNYPYYKKQDEYLIRYYEKNEIPIPEYLKEE